MGWCSRKVTVLVDGCVHAAEFIDGRVIIGSLLYLYINLQYNEIICNWKLINIYIYIYIHIYIYIYNPLIHIQ